MTDPYDDGDDFLTRPLRPDQFDFPKYIAKIKEEQQKGFKKKLCEKFLEMERLGDFSENMTSTPQPGTPIPAFPEVSPITHTDSETVSDDEDYKDASDLFSDEAVELIIKSPKFKKKIARPLCKLLKRSRSTLTSWFQTKRSQQSHISSS